MERSKPDPDNQPNGAPFGADDPTHARQLSREDDRWLRSVVENSSENVTIVDPDGTLRYASPAFERMLGYDPEEAVGAMNVLDHVHPDDLPLVLEETEKALTAGRVVTNRAEYRFRHADGSWRWVESVGTYLLDDPHVEGVVVQTRDITGRKEAEERLAESERRFSTVVSNAHAFVYRCLNEPGWPNEYASDYALELTGYPPEELLVGGSVRYGDLVVEEDRDRVWKEVQEALAVRRSFELRYAIRREDGEVRHVLDHGQGVYEEDGRVVALEGMVHDVTDLVEAQGSLKESEERYRTLVERVPAIAYIHHQKPGEFSGAIYVSPQVETVLGYTQEEYTVEPEFWKSIVHPDDRERVLAEVERTGRTWEAFDLDYRMIAKDGREVWLRESGTLIRREDDGRQVWHGVMFDITELKQVERGLREAEERYRTLVDRVPPTVYIQRPREGETAAYDTTYMSPRVEDLLGYPPARFVEDPGFWDSLIHPNDRERVLAEDERTDRTGEPFSVEYRMVVQDGRVVWVRDEATLVRGDVGEPLYWLGALTDVTERRLAQEALRASEERYRALTQNSSDLLTLMAATGVILYQSPAIGRVLGYSPEELVGRNAFDYVHPDDVQRAERTFAEGLKDPNRYPSLVYRFRHADGSWRWLESVGTNLIGDPAVGSYVVNSRDVTERKEAEEELRKSEERLRSLADSTFEGILITDEGVILEANRALTDMMRYGLEELLGRSVLEFVAPEYEDLVRHKIATGAEEPYEIVGVRKDGSLLDLEVRGRAFTYRGRNVRVTAVRDITERKALEERLRHQALHDALTGLPNRQLFVDRLSQALRGTRRSKARKVAVLFMDLDGFKTINDSLGHEIGDRLLATVAERLRETVRPEDTLARFGGDEFIMLIEDIQGIGQAVRVAGRIVEVLREPFFVDGRELFVAVSIGIALGHASTDNPQSLLRDADTAMYRAKEEGMEYEVFDEVLYDRAVGRLELVNDLRRAIEREEFVVHYQPMVNLHTGGWWGLEALVRWDHPDRGLLEPDEFVPVAEESGLVVPMGEQVLKEACRRAKEWQEASPSTAPLVMCVNLSARQLRRPNLADVVEGVLDETDFDGNCLSLDVTETVFVKTLAGHTESLDRLRELGVRITIDDFGTGYSSLAYLKGIPADALKIDRSFVKGLGEVIEDTALVRTVIELAHIFGMEVIAEGVESWSQAALLQDIGCDLAQGFHFSEPLPPEEVLGFLAGNASST